MGTALHLLFNANIYSANHVAITGDTVKMICINMVKKSVTVKVGRLLVMDKLVLVFQKLLIYGNFYAQPTLGFRENGLKKRISNEKQQKSLDQRRMVRLV